MKTKLLVQGNFHQNFHIIYTFGFELLKLFEKMGQLRGMENNNKKKLNTVFQSKIVQWNSIQKYVIEKIFYVRN